MSSRSDDGAFSIAGPAVYLTDDPGEASALLRDRRPPPAIWFHATSREGATSAARWGILPGCWRGHDTCAIFGVESLDGVHAHHGDWILEIRSRALACQAKAWWVPPRSILGAWHERAFTRAQALRAADASPPALRACSCGLSGLVREQIAAWRATIAAQGLRDQRNP